VIFAGETAAAVLFSRRAMCRQAGARRESPGTDSLASLRFLPAHRPIGPIGGKFFCTPRDLAKDRSVAPLRRRFALPPARAQPRGASTIIAEMPVPQAFLEWIAHRDGCVAQNRAHARRTRGAPQRCIDRSSRRFPVVHHSLSGFAVFCVVL
jgi:hypothetical protein